METRFAPSGCWMNFYYCTYRKFEKMMEKQFTEPVKTFNDKLCENKRILSVYCKTYNYMCPDKAGFFCPDPLHF